MTVSYQEYPPHTHKRSGCKVGWINFKTKELAEEGSKAARINSRIKWDQGFDFGYQDPGKITEEDDGTFTVCIP